MVETATVVPSSKHLHNYSTRDLLVVCERLEDAVSGVRFSPLVARWGLEAEDNPAYRTLGGDEGVIMGVKDLILDIALE